MALESQTIHIPISGLSQKSDATMRGPGVLERAVNVEYDKLSDGGVVANKRRGYQYVSVSNSVNRYTDDQVMMHVAPFRDELLVFTYDYVASVVDKDANLNGADALVYRGPNNRGSARFEFISSSRTGTTYRAGP